MGYSGHLAPHVDVAPPPVSFSVIERVISNTPKVVMLESLWSLWVGYTVSLLVLSGLLRIAIISN